MIIITDTNIFTNDLSSKVYGNSRRTSLICFLTLIKNGGHQLYVPLKIFNEIHSFIPLNTIPSELAQLIQIKTPNKHELKIPAMLLYDLVDFVRESSQKAQKLAERVIREAYYTIPEEKQAHSADPETSIIRRYKETYRHVTREKIVDSTADVDLLLLAYELDGTIMSVDTGVLDMAEKLGLKIHSHLIPIPG